MGCKAVGPVCCVMHVKEPRTLIVKEKGLARCFWIRQQYIVPAHLSWISRYCAPYKCSDIIVIKFSGSEWPPCEVGLLIKSSYPAGAEFLKSQRTYFCLIIPSSSCLISPWLPVVRSLSCPRVCSSSWAWRVWSPTHRSWWTPRSWTPRTASWWPPGSSRSGCGASCRSGHRSSQERKKKTN